MLVSGYSWKHNFLSRLPPPPWPGCLYGCLLPLLPASWGVAGGFAVVGGGSVESRDAGHWDQMYTVNFATLALNMVRGLTSAAPSNRLALDRQHWKKLCRSHITPIIRHGHTSQVGTCQCFEGCHIVAH